MSTEEESKKPESELGLDLDLHFLPSWAQQPAQPNQYEKFTGEEGAERRGRGRDRGDRPNRGFGGGGPGQNRDRGPRRFEGPRPSGPGGGPRGPGMGGPQGQGQRFPRAEGRGDFRGGGQRRGPGGPGPRQEERPQIKLPELEVTFIPEEKGVESLARQIKLTGRAYPLFEIGYLVLKKPERYHVQLTAKKKEDGQPAQLIYICGLDDTIWLDENEAMHHVLDKHFGTFYSTEKIPTDPPKGVYTFVAQCGMSGTILGPPNYHDYQNKLRKLHQERFSRMPFDMFKARIRIVKDEAIVKKWLEEQSFRTEFTALNIPETLKLNTREEVEKHFREVHLPNVIKPVESYTLPGTTAVNLENRALQALLRRSYDEQMRFPLKVVNILSGQFARQGLQFFKVNKSVTHVAIARPHYLDLASVTVSDTVKKIVDFIDSHPRTTRKKLLQALAPEAASTEAAPAAPVTEPTAATEEGSASAEGGPAAPAASAVTDESSAIISDLHWLVHQGHVIEFANGTLETAKKPLPRPPRPEKKKGEAQAAQPEQAEQGEVTTEAAVPGEGIETAGASESAESVNTPETSAAVQDESGASAGADNPSGAAFPLSTASEGSETATAPAEEQPKPEGQA